MHVIATAGHVDHGKSTLVRALTGMEPDRWAEERRRGMTIDLGFAWTKLADGEVVAFVDVPGHHRFISNMLAGVGPVAAVMFVVAADEGWCQQSAEHLAALHALGVRHGVLAVTRADLGDASLAIAEARDRLSGTSLSDLAAVAVSPVTGAGLDDLRTALHRLVSAMPPPPPGPTRLWVDRAFTVRGAGTVVTGTLSSGTVKVGDELWLTPTGCPVRVRGLQSLQKTVTAASAVARLAVNLRGLSLAEVGRGQALVAPAGWTLTTIVDVRLVPPPAPDSLAASDPPTVARLPRELTLHVGSAGVPVRVRRLGADTARLTLSRPIPVHVGERALLRDPGAGRVAAGLIVLDVLPPLLRGRGSAARRAEVLAGLVGAPDPVAEVRRRGAIRQSLLIAAGVLAEHAPAPPGVWKIRDWLVDPVTWRSWMAVLLTTVDEWAAAHPMAPALPRSAAARALDLPDPRLLDQLIGHVPELVPDAGGVRRRGVAAVLPAGPAAGLARLRERLAADPFRAPEIGDLAALGLSNRHLATAVRAGLLLRVADGVFLLPDAPAEAARRVAALGQPFTLSQARDVLGTTRRVVVPLFELLDARGITRRVDERYRELLAAPDQPPPIT